MPFVDFAGHVVECPRGANLRVVLLRARLPLYSGAARALNCRGAALCGTCAVGIAGEVSAPTEAELRRLSHFPHQQGGPLRLACQCNVLSDLKVTRYSGLFGHRTDAPRK